MENTLSRYEKDSLEALKAAYLQAAANEDAAGAAEAARAYRNKLLDESDKQVTLDRLGVDFTDITKLLQSLRKALSGAWTKYRQALRDLTDQPGFPFHIDFPAKPEE